MGSEPFLNLTGCDSSENDMKRFGIIPRIIVKKASEDKDQCIGVAVIVRFVLLFYFRV